MRKRAKSSAAMNPAAKEQRGRPRKAPSGAPPRPQAGLARRLYQATGVETLDRAHTGLKDFVETSLDKHVPHREISRLAKKRFRVRLSSGGIARHWKRRVLPEEEKVRGLIRESKAKAKVVRAEAARFPRGDASKIIEALISQQIIEDKLKLGQADILKLAAEQRLRKRLELEQGRLKLAARRARDEQKLSEARLEQERQKRASLQGVVEGAEAAARAGQPFDPAEVYAKIAAVITGGEAMEERIENSE